MYQSGSGQQYSQRGGQRQGGGGGREGNRGRGRGRGGGGSGGGGDQRGNGWGGRGGGSHSSHSANINFTSDPNGHLCCNYVPSAATSNVAPCAYRTSSPVALVLHKADRHLVLPPGGQEELERLDPMLVEERQDAERKAKFHKKRNRDDEAEDEEGVAAIIPGLNLSLSSPALLDLWIQERKKRWPSTSVVEQRRQEEEDSRGRGEVGKWASNNNFKAAVKAVVKENAKVSPNDKSETDSSISDGASEGDESDEEAAIGTFTDPRFPPPPSPPPPDDRCGSDSDSDMDPERDAISSKAPPDLNLSQDVVAARPSRQTCQFYQQGRCKFGADCKQPHDEPATHPAHPSASNARAPPVRANLSRPQRPRPKAPPRNPFDVPSLEMSLLRAEINQHVSATAQCVRFLRRNGWLDNVALEVTGTPAEAGQKIEVLKEERAGDGVETAEEVDAADVDLQAPIVVGALASVQSSETPGSRSLLEADCTPSRAPTCPTQLRYPPEPSLFLYLDPLRATEPKPLLRIQFLALSTDAPLRRLLNGYALDAFAYTHAMEATRRRSALRGALEGIDDLPSEAHRRAALEYILGISPHQPGRPGAANHNRPTPIPPPGERRGRVITERELLGLGLRIGPDEAGAVRDLASRVSAAVLVPFSDLCPDPDEEKERNVPSDFVPSLPLPPQKAVPEFEAMGWGNVERDRERAREHEEVWRKLGLELTG